MTSITLATIGNDGTKAMAFASQTVASYKALAIVLHQTACITFFRAAQFGDCDSLNLFYAGLRVNDRSAFRVWVGQHAGFADLDNGSMRHWLKWSEKEGFTIVKGTVAARENLFTIDTEEAGKTMLLSLKPFYDKNVKDKSAITLEALIAAFQKSAKMLEKKSKDEGITLPTSISNLVKTVDRETSVEIANLKRVTAE